MTINVEGIRVNGLTVNDLLNPSFISELSSISPDIEAVAVVMMKKNGNKNLPAPIVFNHQNTEEVKQKIMHIGCPDSLLMDKISKVLEEIIKK